MRTYVKALHEYEDDTNGLELLCNFVNMGKSNLVTQYCQGSIYLPSFILLKKLRERFLELVSVDKELDILFVRAIKCSKLFYSRTIALTKNTADKVPFEDLFKQTAQPIGQQLINLLFNIKYRIRLVRLRRQTNKRAKIINSLSKLGAVTVPLVRLINDGIYKLSLMQSAHHSLTKKLYYFIIGIILIGFWTIDSLCLDAVSIISTIIVNIIFCLAITILAINAPPIENFSYIDITGKNIVAYSYKLFFNNTSNKKMYNIFLLQYKDGPGQDARECIESARSKGAKVS